MENFGTAKTLTIANLQDLDGGAAAAMVNHALRRACLDIADRYHDGKKRKVVVTLELEPIVDKKTGGLDDIGVTVLAQTTLPKESTKTYHMEPDSEGRLFFQPSSPADPRQGGLPYNVEKVDTTTGEVTPHSQEQGGQNDD